MADDKTAAEKEFSDLLDTSADDTAAAPAAPKPPRQRRAAIVPPEPLPDRSEEPADEGHIETDEEREIRELKEALAEPAPVEELSAAQQEILELREQLAAKRAAEAEGGALTYAVASEGSDKILIHFVKDGMVAQGVTWYRGQELEFDVKQLPYQQTKDRNGDTWLDLRNDVEGQIARFGDEYFREGPWRGRKWNDFTQLSENEIALAKRAADAETRRRRAAPIIR